jgi:hypothetical protein
MSSTLDPTLPTQNVASVTSPPNHNNMGLAGIVGYVLVVVCIIVIIVLVVTNKTKTGNTGTDSCAPKDSTASCSTTGECSCTSTGTCDASADTNASCSSTGTCSCNCPTTPTPPPCPGADQWCTNLTMPDPGGTTCVPNTGIDWPDTVCPPKCKLDGQLCPAGYFQVGSFASNVAYDPRVGSGNTMCNTNYYIYSEMADAKTACSNAENWTSGTTDVLHCKYSTSDTTDTTSDTTDNAWPAPAI